MITLCSRVWWWRGTDRSTRRHSDRSKGKVVLSQTMHKAGHMVVQMQVREMMRRKSQRRSTMTKRMPYRELLRRQRKNMMLNSRGWRKKPRRKQRKQRRLNLNQRPRTMWRSSWQLNKQRRMPKLPVSLIVAVLQPDKVQLLQACLQSVVSHRLVVVPSQVQPPCSMTSRLKRTTQRRSRLIKRESSNKWRIRGLKWRLRRPRLDRRN